MISSPKDEEREKKNLDDFNRLADTKERLDARDMDRYVYLQDANQTEYRGYTHRQGNEKFKGEIVKYTYRGKAKTWQNKRVKKEIVREFSKKKTMWAWLRKKYDKAQERIKIADGRRMERHRKHEAEKPQYTETQKQIMKYTQKIENENKLIQKSKTKIKRCNTLINTHTKRIKYFAKQISKLQTNEIKA